MKRHVSKRRKGSKTPDEAELTADVAIKTEEEVVQSTSVQDLGSYSKIVHLGQRQIAALESGILADVMIIVGDVAIKCHSFILSLASPKLATIVKENGPRLCDVDPRLFRMLLEIIYGGGFVQVPDVATLLQVAYLAHEFQVPTACSWCASYLGERVDTENLWRILNFANLITDAQLEEACFRVIRFRADYILQTDAFLNCSITRLQSILRQDTLFNVTELRLFQACVAWAKANLDEAESRRAALGSAIRLIRFRLFSTEDFAKHACPTGLLSMEMERNIFRSCAIGESFMPDGFSENANPRDPAGRAMKIKFQSSGERKAFNRFPPTRTSLLFSADRDAFALGVSIRAWRSNMNDGRLYEESVSVILQVTINGRDTIEKISCQGQLKKGEMFSVKFRNPLEIIRGFNYSLHVSYVKGEENYISYELYMPSTVKGKSGLELRTIGEALAPPDLLLIVADKFT